MNPSYTNFLLICNLLKAKVLQYAKSQAEIFINLDTMAVIEKLYLNEVQLQAIHHQYQAYNNIFEAVLQSAFVNEIQKLAVAKLLNRSGLGSIAEPEIEIQRSNTVIRDEEDYKLYSELLNDILSQEVVLENDIAQILNLEDERLSGKKRQAPEEGKGKEPASKRQRQLVDSSDDEVLIAQLKQDLQTKEHTIFFLQEEKKELLLQIEQLDKASNEPNLISNRDKIASLEAERLGISKQLAQTQSRASDLETKCSDLKKLNETLRTEVASLKRSLPNSGLSHFRSASSGSATTFHSRNGKKPTPLYLNAENLPSDLIALGDPTKRKLHSSNSLGQLPSVKSRLDLPSSNSPSHVPSVKPTLDDDSVKLTQSKTPGSIPKKPF